MYRGNVTTQFCDGVLKAGRKCDYTLIYKGLLIFAAVNGDEKVIVSGLRTGKYGDVILEAGKNWIPNYRTLIAVIEVGKVASCAAILKYDFTAIKFSTQETSWQATNWTLRRRGLHFCERRSEGNCVKVKIQVKAVM